MDVADHRVGEILDRAMVARIATVSRTGRPHVNPLYFVREGRHVHLGTATFTLAARNVAANPTVQLLAEVEDDPDDRRVVRLDGTATVRTDPDLLRSYRSAVARKYVVTPRGLRNLLVHPRQWRPLRRHVSGGEGCVLDVEVTGAEVLPSRERGAADL
jgi:general stress protein 26